MAEVPKWKRGEIVRLVKTAEQMAAAAKLFLEGRQAAAPTTGCRKHWMPDRPS